MRKYVIKMPDTFTPAECCKQHKHVCPFYFIGCSAYDAQHCPFTGAKELKSKKENTSNENKNTCRHG